MSIVAFISIAVIVTTVLAFAVVLATEASQRRELKRLRVAAFKASAREIAGKREAKVIQPYRTI